MDLIVLDIGLPDISGVELCKEIRKTHALPIIFLTARTDEIDRVVGLEINNFLKGAKSQIVKVVAIAGFAAVVLSYLASLWITRPITRLTRYADDIRQDLLCRPCNGNHQHPRMDLQIDNFWSWWLLEPPKG